MTKQHSCLEAIHTLQVYISAGGKGKRLAELTHSVIPKSLVKLKERPIIAYQLKHLLAYGFRNITLSFNHTWQIELFQSLITEGLIPDHNYRVTIHPYNTPHYLDQLNYKSNKQLLKNKKGLLYTQGDIIYTSSWLKRFLANYSSNDCSIFLKRKPTTPIPPYIKTKKGKVVSIIPNKVSNWSPGPTFIINPLHKHNFIKSINKPKSRTSYFINLCLQSDMEVRAIKISKEYVNINTLKTYQKAKLLLN